MNGTMLGCKGKPVLAPLFGSQPVFTLNQSFMRFSLRLRPGPSCSRHLVMFHCEECVVHIPL